MKKVLSLFLSLLIILVAFPTNIAFATYKEGTVGSLKYVLNGTHLIISGNGDMGYQARWPWGHDITDLTILEGATSIAANAFAQCRSLNNISLPNSLKSIGNNAFYSCESLRIVDIPSGVTTIDNGAFGDCSNLVHIVLPRDLKTLNYGVLEGCHSLQNIEVDEGSDNFSSKNGVLFNANQTALIKYPMGRYENYYSIPNGVKTISQGAFSGNTTLRDIWIPSSVTKIEKDAFTGTDFYEYPNYKGGLHTVGHCIISADPTAAGLTTRGYSVIADGAFDRLI